MVDKTHLPQTVDSLAAQLAACGLRAGQTVLVHTRMSAIGWIVGGPVAVLQALLRVLTPDGTLMMPTHTSYNTNPANWQHPPVPEFWWPIIRDHTPAYDPATAPTRQMGRVAELFRTWPGVVRSQHPVGSFAALGPHAADLTEGHDLEMMFGDASPIGRLYALDGWVLLLGVNHENNTSLHLAEYRADWPGKRWIDEAGAMLVNGQRQWRGYPMLDLESDDFNTLGAAYEAAHGLTVGRVGQAEVRLLRQRPMVDYAVDWMAANRDFTQEGRS